MGGGGTRYGIPGLPASASCSPTFFLGRMIVGFKVIHHCTLCEASLGHLRPSQNEETDNKAHKNKANFSGGEDGLTW